MSFLRRFMITKPVKPVVFPLLLNSITWISNALRGRRPKSKYPYVGFSFLFWIFTIKNPDKRLILHESIHLAQQRECLYVIFFYLYISEYIWLRFLRGLSRRDAYRNISFEKEAYMHDDDEGYLERRKPYAWLFLEE